jgi:hypothetical protein
VDLALSLICTVGYIIAGAMALQSLAAGLSVCACIFCISGSSGLRNKDVTDITAAKVNELWNLKLQ